MPFISFIVPVFNIRKYLSECVESIVSGPFSDWEILLIDDRSNDGSEILCDRFAAEDERISVVHMPENVGPGGARNRGLHLATGDYVFFLDGDDTIDSGIMRGLFDFIGENNYPDLVRVGYTESFGRTRPAVEVDQQENIGHVCSSVDFLRPILERQHRVGFRAWEFVIKKSMLLDCRLSFGYSRVWEDNDFVMRCIFASRSIGEYRRAFYNWKIRLSGSLTSAHLTFWDHVVKSAGDMLQFACSRELCDVHRQYALRCVYSCILDFEAIAGAVSPTETSRLPDLFLPFENHLSMLAQYIYPNGLLWYIRELGATQGAAALCAQRAEEACALLDSVTATDILGFPSTRKCLRLLSVLGANGFEFKGVLDNDPGKQGLMLDGRVIFNPEMIPLCYDDYSKLFVIISTSTRKTGKVLADQLRSFGLKEGIHFITTGPEED